jgi:hypothetical protein
LGLIFCTCIRGGVQRLFDDPVFVCYSNVSRLRAHHEVHLPGRFTARTRVSVRDLHFVSGIKIILFYGVMAPCILEWNQLHPTAC